MILIHSVDFFKFLIIEFQAAQILLLIPSEQAIWIVVTMAVGLYFYFKRFCSFENFLQVSVKFSFESSEPC